MEEMVGFLFKIFKSTVLLLFEGVSSLTVNHLFALLVQAVKAGEKFLIETQDIKVAVPIRSTPVFMTLCLKL